MNFKSLKGARSGAKKAANDAQRALHQLREHRVGLLDRREYINTRAVPLAEAQDAATTAVQRKAQQGLKDLWLAPLIRPSNRRRPQLRLRDKEINDLVFAANADALCDLLCAHLAAHYETEEEPLSASEQEQRLATIDEEILSTELAEEGVVRELEAAGFEVLRREDADPRALLAAESEVA